MAGLSSAAGVIGPALQGLNVLSSIVQTGDDFSSQRRAEEQSLKELQQRQQEDMRAAQEDAALEREKIALESEAAERERRDALKRATARQRARFGSSGIDTNTSSSAQAVLLGLFDESEEERQEREALDDLRNRALDSDLAQRSRLNVLQQTQLKERNKLNNVSSANSLTRGLISGASSAFNLFG